MKKNKYMTILLISMMLVNSFLTPQTVYAVSEMTTDENATASEVESSEPAIELKENAADTAAIESEKVELMDPPLVEEPVESETTAPEEEAVINNEPESIDNNGPPAEEEPKAAEEPMEVPAEKTLAEQDLNLVTSFKFTLVTAAGEKFNVENGSNMELNLNDMNAVQLIYGLTKPDDLYIAAGDTYTIPLPSIFASQAVEGKDIQIDGVTVASYSILEGQLIITFNESVNEFDNIEMHADLSGSFNKSVFEAENEVVVNLPYSEGNTYTATVRAEKQEYAGEDQKTAGKTYILDEEGNKQETTKNPTHMDWTVVVNDSMDTYENATVIDDLGNHLEIVKDSITVHKMIRNYNNQEIDRVKVAAVPELTETGFELDLGAVDSAYEITYTTRLLRPEGGGKHTINNSARIVLDGKETNLEDSKDVVWSVDLPIITKNGAVQKGNPNKVDWEVQYNYRKESLGTVTLTDQLTKGDVLLETVKVYEVVTDADGNVVSKSDMPIDITPEKNAEGNVIFPNLDANGKAYQITFSSSVPFGMNESIGNTISDNLGNLDDAIVNVNTIPTGGKIGAQKIDSSGRPYVEWTISLNTQKIDVKNIRIKDVFDQNYLSFDVNNAQLYSLNRNGTAVNNYSINEYTHEDGRKGFELAISDAGPHEYKFVYRTYYTQEGMKQPQLANNAELLFDNGGDEGIKQAVKATQTGVKAGIEKTGRYVGINNQTQQIEWTITFNKSRLLLENPKIVDTFQGGNYRFIDGTMVVKENGKIVTDYVLNLTGTNGFTVDFNKNTNAVYTITYRTTTDDAGNGVHNNLARLEWPGGSSEARANLGKRGPGINKTGVIVVNPDGSKSINWTVNFNTNASVLRNFKLTDTNTPNTVQVSNIKVIKTVGNQNVTNDFVVSNPGNGIFTLSANQIDATPYRLTYTTTLSPEDEMKPITNKAFAEYVNGHHTATATIANPILSVSKKAVDINKTLDPNRINWQIFANDNTQSKHVNLVNAVLKDTIPLDQKLLPETIVVTRADTQANVTDTLDIAASDNAFEIQLPDGPYQYNVSYQTEIVKYPSVNPTNINRYDNYTKLTNQTGTSLERSDDATAFIDYFSDGTNNNTTKTGTQNTDTENTDWTAVVNPRGLAIDHAVIEDTLSSNSTYVQETVQLTDGNGTAIPSELYTLTFAENNRSFTVTFDEAFQLKSPVRVSYSTRLDENLIGSYKVTNTIELFGGTQKRSIHKQLSETNSQQWFYGGGGSGRTVQFEIHKQNANGASLQGAEFKLERVNLNNSTALVEAEVKTNEQGVYISGDVRAGRYKLTETKAPEGFVKLKDPIYFTVGYSTTGQGYTAAVTNAQWQQTINPNVKAAGNVLTVVNDYQPVSVTLEAVKSLEGNKTLTQGQFAFELLQNGKVIDTQTNDAEGNVVFKAMSYNKTGTYHYQIREVKGKLGGVTYDSKVHDVTVTVGNKEDKTIEATVSYGNELPKFTNTYQAAPTNMVLKAKKLLEGQVLQANQFAFDLVDAEGKVLQTVKNNAAGEVVFDPIAYDAVGEYSYTIREVNNELGGIIYDAREYPVDVKVIDNGEGAFVATANYLNGPAVFTNNYTAKPDSVILEASKTLTGQKLAADQFAFELIDSSGKVIQTATNNESGQIVFEQMTYDKVGKYTYTIREIPGELGGITYDTKSFTVEVVVEDNGEGNLTATANYIDGPAAFTNVYTPAPGSVALEAAKVLTGLELVEGQFSFELVDAEGKVLQTVENNATGQIIFELINYDTVGTYAYTIREVKGSQKGITYDNNEYPVIVEVIDNGKGNLVATESYTDGPARFTNHYVPEADSIVLVAEKVLKGQELTADQFAFELVNAEGTVLQTVTNDATGQIIFDEITYDKVGEHTYTIREVKGVQGGITYDEKEYEVKVTVTDDKEGNLIAKAVYEAEEVVFTNRYSTKEGAATIEAAKVLAGQNLRANHFEFKLLDEGGNVIQTAKNDAAGEIVFEELTFTEPGQYTYSIEEANTKLGGVAYDESRYTATVMVTDNGNGQLETKVEYNKTPQFTNQYTAAPYSVELKAEKLLEGQVLTADQFTFELVDAEGNVLQTVQNDAEGQIAFEEITYDKVGEHSYTIREVEENLGGVTYDATEFLVNVIVTDDGNGQLTAVESYVDGPAVFNNKYTAAPDSVVFEAAKILEGHVLTANQFSFELVNAEGEVLQTVTNNAEGQILFDEINYDTVGEQSYTIREVKGDLGGITYDTKEYTVDVVVSDEGKGQLSAMVNYVDGPVVFTNRYTAAPDSVVIEADKTLNGLELVDGQFAFELVNEEGDVLQTVYNNAAGQVIFEEITYDKVGKHSYIVREVEGTQSGITYDSREFTVDVVVEDDGNGNLAATANYVDGPISFVNKYIPAPDSVVLEASKTLTGLELVDEQFVFELVNEEGDILQTATNNAAGQIIFDEMTYDKVGKHSYTIREVEGKLGGVTYDTKEFKVDVVVSDEGKGQLSATVNYVDGPAEFVNEYVPASDSVVLEASKILNGLKLVNGQFVFELVNEEGDVLQTATNNAEGQIIFEEMTYDQVGEYSYTIREVKGTQEGIVYDPNEFTVKVTVDDNGEGNLVASETYPAGPAVFRNEYIPASDSVVLEASKTLTGLELVDGQFAFELMDEAGNVLQTVSNNASGQIIFDEIVYDKAGEYGYTIREVRGTQSGVTYDAREFAVSVVVEDDGNGSLTATANYVDGPSDFVNEYVPAADSIVIEAVKVLEGQLLTADQFIFELVNEDGEVLQTVQNTVDGQVIFGEIHYETAGTHTYTIREVKGSQIGITYDDTKYTVTVEVEDNKEGQLAAKATYTDGPAVFINTFTPIEPASPFIPTDPTELNEPLEVPESKEPVEPAEPNDPKENIKAEKPAAPVKTVGLEESNEPKQSRLPQTGEAASYTGAALLLLSLGLMLAFYERKRAKEQ